MNGKNHPDDAGRAGAVNREVKANEATRVIDDDALPPQPGAVPRQAPATAPSDVVQAGQKFSVHEQTRIENTPQPQTRFIGAYASEATADTKKPMQHVAPSTQEQTIPVVGWLVVIAGPGRGRFRAIGEGSNPIGRAPTQRIPLDFGDDAISSEKQAYLIYDPQQRDFLVVPNLERSNLVSLNGTRVTGAMPLKAGDVISMGQTKLYFQPLCGPGFDWNEVGKASS